MCQSYSQELLKPQLEFTNACASNSFNDYRVEVTFINAPFNNDNVFEIQLSDETGSFDSPRILTTINDKNFAFRFDADFGMPTNVAGNNYQIRVKGTSPEAISPPSDVFEAYYMSNEQLVLNNFEDVAFCEGGSQVIEVTSTTGTQFQWYKDGIKLVLGGNTLEVYESSVYYCEIYYGSCNSPATSNIVNVTESNNPEAILPGSATVEICEGDSYTLQPTQINANYNYYWYKDGSLLSSLPLNTSSLTVDNDSELGSYYVEIENEIGCKSTSNTITISKTALNFTVNIASSLHEIILVGDAKVLSIEHTATNGIITWYKDGIAISNSDTKDLTVTESGEYYAEVTETVNGCSETKATEKFFVYPVSKINFSIAPTNYENCVSTTTTLSFDELIAEAVGNNTEVITIDKYQYLEFAWYKDGSIIPNATSKDLVVDDYTYNGSYELEIKNGTTVTRSNSVTVNLQLPSITATSANSSNALNYQFLKPNTIAPLVGLKKGNFYASYGFGINTNITQNFNAGSHMITLGFDFVRRQSAARCTQKYFMFQ